MTQGNGSVDEYDDTDEVCLQDLTAEPRTSDSSYTIVMPNRKRSIASPQLKVRTAGHKSRVPAGYKSEASYQTTGSIVPDQNEDEREVITSLPRLWWPRSLHQPSLSHVAAQYV